MNELTIKSDECTKNSFTVSFLWSLKNSGTTTIDGVENYLAVLMLFTKDEMLFFHTLFENMRDGE